MRLRRNADTGRKSVYGRKCLSVRVGPINIAAGSSDQVVLMADVWFGQVRWFAVFAELVCGLPDDVERVLVTGNAACISNAPMLLQCCLYFASLPTDFAHVHYNEVILRQSD